MLSDRFGIKYILTALLYCVLWTGAGAQQYTLISKRKLDREINLDSNWLYKPGDDTSWASPKLNDAAWSGANTERITEFNKPEKELPFDGIGWFRLHIYVDSTVKLQHVPGMRISHSGASEIYVDGRLVRRFGYIGGKDSSEYCEPTALPAVLPIHTPGPHLIAIRYANYRNFGGSGIQGLKGFIADIGYAQVMFESQFVSIRIFSYVLLLLAGIFLTLSLIHFSLYLYDRKQRSNTFFSTFTFSISTLLTGFYVLASSFDPGHKNIAKYVIAYSLLLACYSFSGFNNILFSPGRLRLKIVGIYCILAIIIWSLNIEIAIGATLILLLYVLIETIILNIRAIYKNIPGARIIGTGVLFAAAFLITCILAITIDNDSLNFEDTGSPLAVLFFTALSLAILSIPGSISVYLAWNFARTSKNLTIQLHQVQLLSEKMQQQEMEKQRILEGQKETLETEVANRTAELRTEKKRSDDLLLNILPEEIAEELKEKGTSSAKHFDHVSVLFTDFVDFTKAGERLSPQELVDELHTCFKAFDEIISKYNIEKIKTIGDAYLAVAGLPHHDPQHAINITRAALEIRSFMAERKRQLPERSFAIRIGIHSGSVVAGIVGVKKFAYDIWGDTVNTAARMEQNSEAGKVNISQFTYELIKDHFACSYRGQIAAKNKGELNMYFVENEL